MMSTPMHSGDRPGEDAPRRDVTAPSGDVLDEVLARFGEVEAGPAARALLAQVLAATLLAFTRTRSVRDPLPDTTPGSAEEALAVLAGIDHLRASLAGVGAIWQVTAEERIRRDDSAQGVPSSRQGRGAGQEIALARRISPSASSLSQAKARRLVQNMPGAVDSLWSGAMTDQQASAISGALDGAGADTCRRIDDHLREHPEFLEGKGNQRLQADVRDLVQTLEPERSRDRAERAARSRHVRMTPLADGMARVTAVLRGIDAVALMQSLHTRAESLRAAGAKTSLPALEADLLVEDVLRSNGQATPSPDRPRLRPGLDIGIVITDTALLGRDDDAGTADLAGYGTIPSHIVRDTLLGSPPGHLRADEGMHPDQEVSAFYRRLYRSPRTRELIAMESRARAFPAGLARMILWRDTTCRTPWCNARIRHSDHVVPHHRGGETSFANGQGLCARCNLLKEHGLWILSPLRRAQNRGDDAASHRGSGADSTDQAPSDSSTPPVGWLWVSPHGALGPSPTPPLITPWPDPPPGLTSTRGRTADPPPARSDRPPRPPAPPPDAEDHDDPAPPGTSSAA